MITSSTSKLAVLTCAMMTGLCTTSDAGLGMRHADVAHSNLSIRYLKDVPEHIEVCARWSFETWGHHTSERSLHDFIMSRQDYAHSYELPCKLVECLEGVPVGMCSLSKTRGLPLAVSPWLSALYVAPEYRNRGIGTALVTAIEQRAFELGYRTVYCFTSDPAVVPWYLARGYTLWKTSTVHNHEVIVLVKSISS